MTETIRFGQIGREDVNRGTGSFSATLADGNVVTLSQIMLYEYAEDTGAADAYVVTVHERNPYVSGYLLLFKATAANTGASTLNVNSIGTRSIVKSGSNALVVGDIVAGQIVAVIYDATNQVFHMISEVFKLRTINAGLTASTTQTQGQGALTKDINEVSTVSNTNDTVTLPAAVAGKVVVVINNGANTLQVFPASGDNLGAGANTAITQLSGTNRTYIAIDDTNWETSSVVKPQYYTTGSGVSSPTGTTDTSGLMMGLAGSITPVSSGVIFVAICGSIANSAGNSGGFLRLRYGTGTAPSNGDALTGTAYGSTLTLTQSESANDKYPFCLTAIIAGLTVGTAYWLDVHLAAVTAGTATISSVNISSIEL